MYHTALVRPDCGFIPYKGHSGGRRKRLAIVEAVSVDAERFVTKQLTRMAVAEPTAVASLSSLIRLR